MKLFVLPYFLSTAAYLLTPSVSQAQSLPTLQKLEGFYAQIMEHDPEYLFLSISHDQEEISELLSLNAECKSPSAYKRVSATALAQEILNDLSQGYEAVADRDDGYYTFMENVSGVLDDLKKELKGTVIKRCSQFRVPAYSDGHKTTFFKFNDVPGLVLEVGQPD